MRKIRRAALDIGIAVVAFFAGIFLPIDDHRPQTPWVGDILALDAGDEHELED
jgi:hypothetical protein